jgi:pyruvate dehydrogenase E2 component (dihydrolipoamide acetyltransferase)
VGDITMPRLTDSMEEGTIVGWLKRHDDQVEEGDALLEIDTDKATMVYESPDSGVLTILEPNGATVPVGAVIGRLQSGPERLADTSPRSARITVSPIARRLAEEHRIDLEALVGTGPGGRVVRADVEAALAGAHEPTLTVERRTRYEPFTREQAVVARRMVESKSAIPEFVLDVEIDLGGLRDWRESLRGRCDVVPTYNDAVIKASALALRAHPWLNASYKDDGIELHEEINVGVAVASDRRLVVPTIFGADEKPLTVIAEEVRSLAKRVRERTVTPPELSGGTFTVSNLGMLGVRRFTAVINPPQAAILAVGTVEERVVVRDGDAVIRPMMLASLACDHRVAYGADAAAFLQTLREHLEEVRLGSE